MSFLHGINVAEVKTTRRSIVTVATAVIGLVATAPDAAAGAFPLDTAVTVTNLADAIVKAGPTGTLRAALTAIAGQVTAPVVVVRVASGADAAATATAVIGTDEAGVKTGMGGPPSVRRHISRTRWPQRSASKSQSTKLVSTAGPSSSVT